MCFYIEDLLYESVEYKNNCMLFFSQDFMLKVRQMLKASRQKVYKEDLFGD